MPEGAAGLLTAEQSGAAEVQQEAPKEVLPTESTTPEPAEQPEKPVVPQRKALRDLIKEDDEYRKEFEVEVNREKQRELARWKREREKETVQRAREDASVALEYAQSKAKEFEEEDKSVGLDTQAYDDAREIIKYHAEDKEWAREYDAWLEENRKDADERFGKDPSGYVRWANTQVIKRLAHIEAKKMAGPIAEALAEQKTKTLSQSIPRPPEGGPSATGPSLRTEAEVRAAIANDQISVSEGRRLLARMGVR